MYTICLVLGKMNYGSGSVIQMIVTPSVSEP